MQDAEGQGGQQDPADEAEVQHEGVPLVALHHPTGQGDGLGAGKLRVLLQDVGHHAIGIGLDDAGDDEQQRPQDEIDVAHEQHDHCVGPSALPEKPEDVFDLALPLSVEQEEAVAASGDGVERQNLQQEGERAPAADPRRDAGGLTIVVVLRNVLRRVDLLGEAQTAEGNAQNERDDHHGPEVCLERGLTALFEFCTIPHGRVPPDKK